MLGIFGGFGRFGGMVGGMLGMSGMIFGESVIYLLYQATYHFQSVVVEI